jgi:uncharacterized protein (TIGR03067 family)
VGAARRHVIILTDGDPALSNENILAEFRRFEIDISVVHIDIHNQNQQVPVQMARLTGGVYHYVRDAKPSVIERLFQQEVARLRRSPPSADEASGTSGFARSDHDLFRGVWRIVFSEDGGRPNPQDDLRFVFTFADGSGRVQVWDDGDLEETGTYTIDETKQPKAIDFRGLRGFAHDPKNDPRSLGIYEFVGQDQLRICLSEEPKDGYPTNFASEPQSVNDVLLELRLVTRDTSALDALGTSASEEKAPGTNGPFHR